MDAVDYLPAVLAAVASNLSRRPEWVAALTDPMRAAGLTTARRCAMFMGQCAEESGGFTALVENLNYSAARLLVVWPARFTASSAALFSRRPAAIANYVYANRQGNGDEVSGDGWRFRGGGLIQLTGRSAWTRFGETVGRRPEDAWTWAQTPDGAAASACWYWLDRGNLLLDLSDHWQITECTRRINGGLTNLQTRITLCNAALRAIGVVSPDTKTTKRQTAVESKPPPPAPVVVPPWDDPDNSADALNAAELARIRGQTP